MVLVYFGNLPARSLPGSPPYFHTRWLTKRPILHTSGAKEEKLKIVASAMASTGFLPGNFDRAVPFLLHTTWYSETWAGSLRKNYNREMHVLGVTGITRDGWCYIVIYAAVGKVMVDFMVVAMSRLLVAWPALDFMGPGFQCVKTCG